MKIEELFSVRGKVALITGGSRGIGEMIARAYAENGVKVYITARKAEACDALANELSKSGECISIPADISRIDEIDRLGNEIERRELGSGFCDVSGIRMGQGDGPERKIGFLHDTACLQIAASSWVKRRLCTRYQYRIDRGHADLAP